jgi:5-methylcytosine-specific restriction endonuclease McrA
MLPPRKTKTRDSKEYKEWRLKVLMRDGFKCRECESITKLHAHHIKDWQHNIFSRFKVENGITLCESCHIKRHPHMENFMKGKTRKKRRKINKILKLNNRYKKPFGV